MKTSRMTDIKQDHKGEDVDSYGISNSADPKNMQELTQYVQTLLQKMQDKFQTMSDQIIGRNILFLNLTLKGNLIKLLTSTDRDKFCDNVCVDILDEMGNRIDDLEKNIADLMTQAGVEGGDK
ncbi:hypothetical protein HN011_005550 [Eciton burchellii]|nr:hypothetical protein HN011_005550 [Eciton burchellii]